MVREDELDELAVDFFDFEFDFVGPAVEDGLGDDGGEGDDEADGGGEHGFGDAGGDGSAAAADAAGVGEAGEGGDHAGDGAGHAEERGGDADGGEDVEAFVDDGHGLGAVVFHDLANDEAHGLGFFVFFAEVVVGAEACKEDGGDGAAGGAAFGDGGIDVVVAQVLEDFGAEGAGVDAAVVAEGEPAVVDDGEADEAARHEWDHEGSAVEDVF